MNISAIALMDVFNLLPVNTCAAICNTNTWEVELCSHSFHQQFIAPYAATTSNNETFTLLDLCPNSQGIDAAHQILASHENTRFEIPCRSDVWECVWKDLANDTTSQTHRLVILYKKQATVLDDAENYFHNEVQSILDSLHDGLWVIDGQGTTLHVNKALKRIANINPSDMIGKSVLEPLNEGKFSVAVTLEALRTKQVITRFDDYPNGTRCLNTSTPIFDKKGDIWRVVACIRDITELEGLQKNLANAEINNLLEEYQAAIHHGTQEKFLATSSSMRQCIKKLEKSAQSSLGILILGETGTGKTHAASYIHKNSPRANGPFISVNCAAIPPTLIESELFGYDKGAFTGANRSGKKGYFELANEGTLFLDEIGELPLNMQAKVLHALDGLPLRKIGSEREINVDVRIIAATNQPLEQLVQEGRFRADLYYRLRILSINIPPLREHADDITPLIHFFLEKACARHNTSKSFSPKTIDFLCKHTWPGNVRELKATVEFLCTMTEGSVISVQDLPSYLLADVPVGVDLPEISSEEYTAPALPSTPTTEGGSYKESIENLERVLIADALKQTGSSYKAAAKLGISQSTVVRKAKYLGIPLNEKGAKSA